MTANVCFFGKQDNGKKNKKDVLSFGDKPQVPKSLDRYEEVATNAFAYIFLIPKDISGEINPHMAG